MQRTLRVSVFIEEFEKIKLRCVNYSQMKSRNFLLRLFCLTKTVKKIFPKKHNISSLQLLLSGFYDVYTVHMQYIDSKHASATAYGAQPKLANRIALVRT